MKQNRLFIEKRGEGDYAVRRPNGKRASAVEPTQAKAGEAGSRNRSNGRDTAGARQTYVERQARPVAKGRPQKIARDLRESVNKIGVRTTLGHLHVAIAVRATWPCDTDWRAASRCTALPEWRQKEHRVFAGFEASSVRRSLKGSQ